MTLANLFLNIREFSIGKSNLDFTDNFLPRQQIKDLAEWEKGYWFTSFQELLSFDDSVEFAAKKSKTPKVGAKVTQKSGRVITCDPGRTYPCGASCRSQAKPCKNPIEGQAKTYAEFLKAENSLNKPSSKQKRKPIKDEKIKPNRDNLIDLQFIPDLETAEAKFEQLGKGAFGSVYLDNSTKPPRAIKYGDIGKDEVRLGRKLAELGISPEVFSTDKTLLEDDITEAFAMEFIDGDTLKNHANYGFIKPSDFEQILRMRQKMHENGIYNFDCNANNIMVTKKGELKLIDSGLAGESLMLAYTDAISELAILVEESSIKDRYREAIKKRSSNPLRTNNEKMIKDEINSFYKEVLNDK